MKLLPQHISSLLYVNMGIFLALFPVKLKCTSAECTQRLLPLVLVAGALKETPKSCHAEQTSSLTVGNLSHDWGN